MKRLMFLIVSAFIATTSYCANVSDNIMNVLAIMTKQHKLRSRRTSLWFCKKPLTW